MINNYLSFPWWTKLVAYFISFLFASVSVFFIIIKGITFGNDKCTKWLTSIVISLFSSLLVTQPIQVEKLILKQLISLNTLV